MPRPRWAIWHKGKPERVADEIILQIRVTPIVSLGWCDQDLGKAWKEIFPITPSSIRMGSLPLDHQAWGLTPNPWWRFIMDLPLLSWEEATALSKQRRPSVMPHFVEFRWIIQERKLVDFRGMATAHLGNHPVLKLVQILVLVKRCNVLIYCREEMVGLLKYMMIWKLEWRNSKDLLKRMGWSMVESAIMNPDQIEVPIGHFV